MFRIIGSRIVEKPKVEGQILVKWKARISIIILLNLVKLFSLYE